MSFVEDPQPVDPTTAGRLPVEAAPLQEISRHKQSAHDLRESGQDAREASQDSRESGQDLRETGQDLREVGADSRETVQDARQTSQDLRESGQDTRESDQDLQQTSQDSRETGQDLREVGADSRETAQDARETSQDLRKSGLDTRETGQNLRGMSQDTRETDQNLRGAGQNTRETGQDLRGKSQDTRESDQALRDSGQDLREVGADSRETAQDLRESGQDTRESDQDLQQTSQNLRETGQDLREVGADFRETAQDARETSQDLRKSGQDTRESGQNLRGTSQDSRETDQNLRGAGQNTRETGQDLRGKSQDTRESDQALRESNIALLESENWFRLLVESVTDYAIYMLDPEGRVITWNVGAERSKGYKAEEILGQNYTIFFLPEDSEAGLPADELAAAASLGRYETEAWRMRKDGTKFWALITLTAVRDPKGERRGFANVTRDLSAQKAAEEALRSRNAELERYRAVLDNVDEYSITTLDAQGQFTNWSAGAERITGHTAAEMLGREYASIATEEDRLAGLPQQELEEAARTGRCVRDSWKLRKDGSRLWACGVTNAICDESGKLTGFIRIGRDMTQQKQLEESLAKMAADLEIRVVERTRELETTVEELRRKNQEVEAFVYIVSHDLRAPLVNVQGFVRELDESRKRLKEVLQTCPQWEFCWPGVTPILNEEMGGALHYISASASKFERLIDALLGLSRQGRRVYHLTRVNVWDLATNAVATFRQAIIEAGAEVEVDELPSVTADATALGQVFSNLIGNCLKYRSPDRPLKIEVGGQIETGVVHYWVRDNGLGIPEYGKTKLFQVFQRFHSRQTEGEGMGLAIAHRIVERHGGKIWVESQEGEGTTFHFSLPGHPGSAPKITQESTDHESL
jgi:PAS domain S-box-containing protein